MNITVTNTNDSGNGSLRWAIDLANKNLGLDTIKFNIPTTIGKTITPLSPLPAITDPIIIDGTTQSGYSGTPIIELKGSKAGLAKGLVLSTVGSTIRGLAINSFADAGIVSQHSGANKPGNVIQGNFIGTDVTGTQALGNGKFGHGGGVVVTVNDLLGGLNPRDRNIISGNYKAGVFIRGKNVTVQGNYIGIGLNGKSLGNTGSGINNDYDSPDNIIRNNTVAFNQKGGLFLAGKGGHLVEGNQVYSNLDHGVIIWDNAPNNELHNNSISANAQNGVLVLGDNNILKGNTIFANTQDGIEVDRVRGTDPAIGTNNKIQENSIYNNGGLGIDLSGNSPGTGDGVTLNDNGDGDTGANERQNYPILSKIAKNGSNIAIQGNLNSAPNQTYRIEFFANNSVDSSGYGEGETYLDFLKVTTDNSGNASFSKTLSANVSERQYITATASDAVGNTSEFSPAVPVSKELTEGNANLWSAFASDGAIATVNNDTTHVRVGEQSLKFVTQSGFDTGIKYTAPADAHLDLSEKNYLTFWAYAINNNPNGFQGNQPVIVLNSPNGSFRYEPQGNLMSNNGWRKYAIPLEGNSQWVRTTTGTPNFSDITQVEIHQDTWDSGFTVYYDGMEFLNADPTALPPQGPPPPPGVNPNEINPKVLLYVFDPIMENLGNKRQHEAYGWGDPVTLTNQIVADFQKSSHGLVNYQLVDTQIVDQHPYFADGFQHTDESFAKAWSERDFHKSSSFDYQRFVAENNIAARIDSGEIDEVWVYSGPIGGMYESVMAGKGAYWINGPAQDVGSDRAFPIMGLNFERGVGEAIHSFGHRAESIMDRMYGVQAPNQENNWNKFTFQDRYQSGQGGVGNVHFPVNGTRDYDYNNQQFVLSNADDWYNYPNFTGSKRSINSQEWSPNGKDPQREYLNWWYDHLPHFGGRGSDYYLNNWWRYITDVDQFKFSNGNLYLTNGIPTVNITTVTDESTSSGSVKVVANSFVDGALGRVDLYVDNSYFKSDTLSPYTFSLNPNNLTGTHTVVAKAYELQNGTEAVSEPVNISTVTTTLPTQVNTLFLIGTENINGTGNDNNNTITGNSADNILNGGKGNDSLDGSQGKDILIGVDVAASNPGLGEIDLLTGGNGADRFMLGNATTAFYDDGNTSTAGTNDYALIVDFNVNQDVIYLKGSKTNYRLDVSPIPSIAGTAVYLDKPGSEPDELIAAIKGVFGLNIQSLAFVEV